MSLNQSIQNYDDSIQKSKRVYSGLLGLPVGGTRQVNIPTRAGYVHVRLRDNLSEVVQAYNDKVSPVYDFPVLLERRGNKWYVTGRDDARYETFGTASPFLPQHGDAHSFNRDGGGGGDTVWIYPDQFVPLLVYPSGTYGASNLMIAPYVLQRESDFIYVGNTGTGNLLIYKPSNSQAIVGLVYIDRSTGNPGVLIASGTPMAGTSTGTAAILPYLPHPSSSQEPLYAFRLVSGSTALNWSNLYNVRQFYGGSSSSTGSSGGGGIPGIVVQDEGVVRGTGTVFNFVGDNVSVTVSGSVARVYVTGSSGGGVPSFITGSIPYAGANGVLTENNELLWWDDTFRGLRLGPRSTRYSFADTFPIGITAKNVDETVSVGLYVYGTGSSGAPSALWNGYRSRGTPSVPLPVKRGDIFSSIVGRGYDGSSFTAQSRINFFANGDAVTGTYAPTGIDMLVIPSGGFSARSQFVVYGDSVNQPTGSTYNIGGVPHTHVLSSSWSTVVSSVTTSNVSAIRWTKYFLDLSGLTADRDFILPTPQSVGEEIELYVSTGDATYELLIKINSVEWSRVFITNEVVKFVSFGTGAADWKISYDGRIPCKTVFHRITSAITTNSAATDTKADWNSLNIDIGEMGDLTNDRANIRRDGYYVCGGGYAPGNGGISDGQYANIMVYKNGTAGTRVQASALRQSTAGGAASAIFGSVFSQKPHLCAAGDYLEYWYKTQEANKGLLNTDYSGGGSEVLNGMVFFSVVELIR